MRDGCVEVAAVRCMRENAFRVLCHWPIERLEPHCALRRTFADCQDRFSSRFCGELLP